MYQQLTKNKPNMFTTVEAAIYLEGRADLIVPAYKFRVLFHEILTYFILCHQSTIHSILCSFESAYHKLWRYELSVYIKILALFDG